MRMTRLALSKLVSLLMVGGASAQENTKLVDDATLRAAAAKPFRLVQKSQDVFYKKDACNSCHHQILPVMMESAARARGVDFDAKFADSVTARIFSQFKDLDLIVQGQFYIDEDQRRLGAAGGPRGRRSAQSGHVREKPQFLVSAQKARPAGGEPWMHARRNRAWPRFTTTAVSASGLWSQLYLPEQFKDEKQALLPLGPARGSSRLSRGRRRIRLYQLLGLFWTGADEADARQKAAQLLRRAATRRMAAGHSCQT